MIPSDLVERSAKILDRLDLLDPAHSEDQRTLATRACLAFHSGKTGDAVRQLLLLSEHAKSADEKAEWLQLMAAMPSIA